MAKVELVERLGERTLVYARLAERAGDHRRRTRGDSRVKIGDEVPLKIDGAAAHVFGADGTGHPTAGRMTAQRRWRGCLFVAPFLLLSSIILIFPLLRGMWLSLAPVDLFGARPFRRRSGITRDCFAIRCSSDVAAEHVRSHVDDRAAADGDRARARDGAQPGEPERRDLPRHLLFVGGAVGDDRHADTGASCSRPTPACSAISRTRFGSEPLPFLSDEHLVLPALAITTIWWSVGLPMLLFLAGLQQIPEDMYEAAALDNASRWTTFWRITLPSLEATDRARRHAADERRSCRCSASRNC